MEEIQQIKGWETTTQTDLYKQIHNQNNTIKPIKQRNINRDQNGPIQRNYPKKLTMKIQAQVKKNMTFQQSFNQQQNSLQVTLLEHKNVKIKKQIAPTGQNNEMKQEVKDLSQNKYLKQFQYEQKRLREELKRKYIKRRSILSDPYKVPFVNQYFLTQNKQQKKNKENFDNKELVFCSTMMQKQRSQRIQNIYYKSKSKNKKNQYFFLQSTEKLKKVSQQSFQLKKQLILQISRVEEQVQKNKSSNILLRKNGKRLNKTKLKKFNQSQTKIKINFQSKVKQEFQILMKQRFKYFPTIFKTDKSCQKEKSHRSKRINENQPLQKLHRRNSSQNIKSKNKDNNRILASLNQNVNQDQFNDHRITQMRQQSCLTTFINT